ncbi:hypothetical protein Prudu_1446S002000, partial [Prunus dulcis]
CIYKTQQLPLSARKRAAAFQRLLAPPPSTNGRGTGGVGTAIESPTFSTDLHPWAARSWRKVMISDGCSPEFHRSSSSIFSFVSSPNQSSKAPEVRVTYRRDLQRVQIARITSEKFGFGQNTGETLPNFRQKSKGKFKKNLKQEGGDSAEFSAEV